MTTTFEAQIIADETVAPRAPWSKIVRAGDVLTIVDLHGNQAVDTLFYGADDHGIRYSARPRSPHRATSS